MDNDIHGSTNEPREAMQRLIEVLALVFGVGAEPAFDILSMGLRFTVDYGPKQQLSVNCSVIEDDRITTLFMIGSSLPTLDLGGQKLFLVKKNASGGSEQRS
jgi:hypothetical protein